jgi:hypothetical protein
VGDENDRSDRKWEEFKELVRLHKFYFGVLNSGATLSAGIVGAIVTFVLNQNLTGWNLSLSLFFPLILSISTAIISFGSAKRFRQFNAWVIDAQEKAKLAWRPHSEALEWISIVEAIVFLVCSVFLLIVIIDPNLAKPLEKAVNSQHGEAWTALLGPLDRLVIEL